MHRTTHASREKREQHVPVLLGAVVRFLASPRAVLIDGTLGDGGHAAALLEASGEGSRLLGIDMDPEGIVRARSRLAVYPNVTIVHETFAHIQAVAAKHGFDRPTGILLDLGMSTHHLGADRGFSFHGDAPLDMRFDNENAVALLKPDHSALQRLAERVPHYTAANIVNMLPEDDIADILRAYGDERHAARIADAIVRERRAQPVASVHDLSRIVVHALPPAARHRRTHAATQTFQALRIAVNREFETLREGIRGALAILPAGSRFGIISFHSGEDRIVKQAFKDAARAGHADILTKQTIRPTWAEQQENHWSRSAKLRVLQHT